MLENFTTQDFKKQFKENKTVRLTSIGVGALAVIVLGYFAYMQFMWKPANEKSKDALFPGLNFAAKDSTDAAINELAMVKKKYDGKNGGELAQFVLARQYMTKGEYKKALKELEGVKLKDTYLSVYTLGLQGDCYSEMKKYKEALEYYEEAAAKNENEKTSPEFLFKAGLVAEELGNFEKATECYTKIKDNYINFSSQKTIDKYIARVKNKVKK
ncbi:MAG: tetratricopeptide repeat protein [Flavobacteriia bacterium]|nr:tetratricopeptide repeat protein [Flavobacteriia bacterium]